MKRTRKRMANTQWYRDRDNKIIDLVKQGKHQEVFDRFGLSDTTINDILRKNGVQDRVYAPISYTLDINYLGEK